MHSLHSTLVLSSLRVAKRCKSRCNLSSTCLLHRPTRRRHWRFMFMRRTPIRSAQSLGTSLGIRPASTCSHSSTRALSTVVAWSHTTAISSPKQRRLWESVSRRRTSSLCSAALITLQVHQTIALSRRRARRQPTDGGSSRWARLRDRCVGAGRRQRSAACATTRRAAAASATRRRSRSSCSARSSCSMRTTTRSRAASSARARSSARCASRSCKR